jgi:hypothetical protein
MGMMKKKWLECCTCVDGLRCCTADTSSYIGCAFISSVAESCVNELRVWSDPWTVGPGDGYDLPATEVTWADISNQFYNFVGNYIKSIPGCELLESETGFRIFQMENIDPEYAALYGIQECDWAIEVYHRSLVSGTGPWISDGLFFNYLKLCGCGVNDSSNVLRWLIFQNVPIGGGVATVDLTLTRPGEGLCGEPDNQDC